MNEIILDLTTMSLQIQMGEAKTTTEMDIDVSYVNDTVGTSRTGASQQSTTNGVTLATILTAPASGHVLVVKQIFVTNKDTVVHTFKIWRVVSGGSNFEVFGETTSIAVGATWDSNASTGGGGGGTTYTGTAPIAVSGSAISLAIDGATAKTTPLGADEGVLGDSAASFASKKFTWSNFWANTVGVLIAALTAKATPVDEDGFEIYDSAASNATKTTTMTQLWANYLKGKADALYQAINTTITYNGWTAGLGTWTYSSADAPTFVISTSVDNSTVIGVGDRIQLTQTTAKYFIVTAITSSTITVYGGTDYTLANATIATPYYSHMKSPFGFPVSAEKWTVTVSDASQRSAACSATVYLNVNSAVSISVPIGRWWTTGTKVGVQCNPTSSANIESIQAALSTSTSSASDTTLEMQVQYFYLTGSYINGMTGTYNLSALINVASKTTYYLIAQSSSAGTMYYRGDNTPSVIKLVCAYL